MNDPSNYTNQTLDISRLTYGRKIKISDYLIFLLGLFGFIVNILSLMNLLCHKRLRRHKYYRAVLFLAFGDALTSGCVEVWFLRKFAFPSTDSDMECLIVFIVMCAAYVQTHFQVVLFALERCLVSVGTDMRRWLCSSNVQIAYIMTSWILCLAYMITFAKITKDNERSALCVDGAFEFFPGRNVDIGMVLVVPFAVLLSVVLLLYSITLRNIFQSARRIHVASSTTISVLPAEVDHNGISDGRYEITFYDKNTLCTWKRNLWKYV